VGAGRRRRGAGRAENGRRWRLGAGCESEAEAGLALAGGLALDGLRSGFSRFGLFQEILVAKFFDLGGKWDEKSSIPREIRGIGARKLVAM
jgi:hypothetical protein